MVKQLVNDLLQISGSPIGCARVYVNVPLGIDVEVTGRPVFDAIEDLHLLKDFFVHSPVQLQAGFRDLSGSEIVVLGWLPGRGLEDRLTTAGLAAGVGVESI